MGGVLKPMMRQLEARGGSGQQLSQAKSSPVQVKSSQVQIKHTERDGTQGPYEKTSSRQ